MSNLITVDPKELMETAVLLMTSAVELDDIGSTLRACTGCQMPSDVRGTVDTFVATLDRILDDMAAGLRNEARDLGQRAVTAANDMLTAAGYAPLPGTTVTTTEPAPYVHSGIIWNNPPSDSSGYGGTMALAAASQKSQERLTAALNRASASGATVPAGSFPMPGALSLTSLPTPYNPWVGMSMSEIRSKVGGLPTASEIKYYNPALASARARGVG